MKKKPGGRALGYAHDWRQMNTVRPEAAGLLLAPVFQAHVEGHGFDWATAVFATSAIHQGSTSRLLGPFQLSIPSKQVLSWP